MVPAPLLKIWASSLCLLILQFDGSFHKAPSPPSLTKKSTSDSSLVSSYLSQLGPTATCAAILQSSDENGTILAIGGRALSRLECHSSIHAEYHGLLLGLNWVRNNIDELVAQEAEAGRGREQDVIVIRGDCKMLIKHLGGQSFPGKLRPEYDRAMRLMEDIERQWSSSSATFWNGLDTNTAHDTGVSGAIRTPDAASFFRVQYVPREQNTLADAVSKQVTCLLRERFVSNVRDAVSEAVAAGDGATVTLATEQTPSTNVRDRKPPLVSASATAGVLNTALRCILEPPDASILNGILRIALLWELAQTADRIGDVLTLLTIGQCLEAESHGRPKSINQLLARNSKPDAVSVGNDVDSCTRSATGVRCTGIPPSTDNILTRDLLRVEGIEMQVAALDRLGRGIEATKLRHKHRYQLRIVSELFDLDTKPHFSYIAQLLGTVSFGSKQSTSNILDSDAFRNKGSDTRVKAAALESSQSEENIASLIQCWRNEFFNSSRKCTSMNSAGDDDGLHGSKGMWFTTFVK